MTNAQRTLAQQIQYPQSRFIAKALVDRDTIHRPEYSLTRIFSQPAFCRVQLPGQGGLTKTHFFLGKSTLPNSSKTAHLASQLSSHAESKRLSDFEKLRISRIFASNSPIRSFRSSWTSGQASSGRFSHSSRILISASSRCQVRAAVPRGPRRFQAPSADGAPINWDSDFTYLFDDDTHFDLFVGVDLTADAPDWFAGIGFARRWR